MGVGAETVAIVVGAVATTITYCLVKVISQIQKSRCVSFKMGCLEVKRDVIQAAQTTALTPPVPQEGLASALTGYQ